MGNYFTSQCGHGKTGVRTVVSWSGPAWRSFRFCFVEEVAIASCTVCQKLCKMSKSRVLETVTEIDSLIVNTSFYCRINVVHLPITAQQLLSYSTWSRLRNNDNNCYFLQLSIVKKRWWVLTVFCCNSGVGPQFNSKFFLLLFL